MLSASVPLLIARKMIRATSGWRSVIIFMLSAQLALRRPNKKGRSEDHFTVVESTPTRNIPRSGCRGGWRKQWDNRADGPQEEVGSRNATIQQEESHAHCKS